MVNQSESHATAGIELLDSWRSIEGRLLHMANLVRDEDWESLVSAQEAYIVALSSMDDQESSADLDVTQRYAKHEILQRIIVIEKGIRERLEARRNELLRCMKTTRHERDLVRSYGVPKRGGSGALGQ